METIYVTMLTAAWSIMAVFGGLYFWNREYRGKQILAFKALATLMPVLLGLYAAAKGEGLLGWLVFWAALLCMTADVLLELHFISGAIVFGMGHVCYVAAYGQRIQPDILTGAVLLVLLGVMFLLHGRELPGLKKKALPALVYAFLLSAMAAMAVTLLVEERSLAGLLTAAGGIAFFLSDNILVKSMFAAKKDKISGRKKRAAGAALLVLYYMAVYLIAAALYV